MATEGSDQHAGEPTTEGFSRLWMIIGQVVAPTTLVTALMVYFGWVRTTVTYSVFGISYTALGLSVQDYLFRSVDTTFAPLAAILLTLILLRPAHNAIVRLVRWPRAGILPSAVSVAGLAVVGVGMLGFTGLLTYQQVEWPLIPMSLGLGVLLVGYGATLRAERKPVEPAEADGEPPSDQLESGQAGGRRPGSKGPAATQPDGDRQIDERSTLVVLQRVAVAAVVVLTLFWSVAVFAQLAGVAEAERIARQPRSLPGVVVFAPQRLHLDGPGVRETTLPVEPEALYRYRYDGLRLLIRSNNRYFLLPARWKPGTRAVVLVDDPKFRMEFFGGA